MWRWMLLACVAAPLVAQYSAARRPRFEEFPAGERFAGPNAAVQLRSASERMFRTRLTEASKEAPNFTGHFRFTHWGCGSNCCAGAFIDLKTGLVVRPPLAIAERGWERWMFSGFFWGTSVPHEHRVDSRLFVVRTGKTYVERLNDVVPDTYYFEWDGTEFRLLLRVPADEAAYVR